MTREHCGVCLVGSVGVLMAVLRAQVGSRSLARVAQLARNSILSIVIFAASQSAAQAKVDRCEWLEWGFGYTKVRTQDEVVLYQLRVSGPNWLNHPFGWHAPGLLNCESCAAGGLYHFVTHTQLDEAPGWKRPVTAAARAARATETFSYPYRTLEPADLHYVSAREPIEVGPLSGYAVYYLVKPRGAALANFELVVLSLADNCLIFESTIQVRVNGGSHWALELLLSELSIVKTNSRVSHIIEGAEGTGVVRPRAPGEKPKYLHEERSNGR